MTAGRIRHGKRWLVIAIAVLAVGVVGGPYVYIHFIEGPAPAPLTLAAKPSRASGASATSGSDPASVTPDGTWNVDGDSVVGYRVKEVLFGQSNVAVGRTSQITGSIVVEGTTVKNGRFTVDMTSVTSDESRRDGQFNGRIMETSTYPTATFELTQPIDLGSIPAASEERTAQATGNLTVHGVTRTVTFTVTGRLSGSAVQVAGSIPVVFGDYGISNPSFGFAQTEDNGLLEFSLNFVHA
jgi:polyisoprenoid-binding protein YceI